MYKIIYDLGYECCGQWIEEFYLVEIFTGTHIELMEHIKDMRNNGCYNISATCVNEYTI